MNIEFDQLPDSARIWIYQCNRTFSEKEQTEITAALKEFIDAWGTHGTPLKAGFKTPYNRFIVIAVDSAAIDSVCFVAKKLSWTEAVDMPVLSRHCDDCSWSGKVHQMWMHWLRHHSASPDRYEAAKKALKKIEEIHTQK